MLPESSVGFENTVGRPNQKITVGTSAYSSLLRKMNSSNFQSLHTSHSALRAQFFGTTHAGLDHTWSCTRIFTYALYYENNITFQPLFVTRIFRGFQFAAQQNW